MKTKIGRANPVLTYLVGLLLGSTVASAYIADETASLVVNAVFVVGVFALVVFGEISNRGKG
ncbi:MAG: hypothetical protein U5J64_08425 [Halobacteriales archaeon]|nr:hypothetical protein [Halobacteriales archaeon]